MRGCEEDIVARVADITSGDKRHSKFGYNVGIDRLQVGKLHLTIVGTEHWRRRSVSNSNADGITGWLLIDSGCGGSAQRARCTTVHDGVLLGGWGSTSSRESCYACCTIL